MNNKHIPIMVGWPGHWLDVYHIQETSPKNGYAWVVDPNKLENDYTYVKGERGYATILPLSVFLKNWSSSAENNVPYRAVIWTPLFHVQ